MQNLVTWPYVLRRGHSPDPSGGACAMDAVNWLVHGKHGDAPECACPVISRYVIVGNDAMPDATRQKLLAYLPRIAGSKSKQHEVIRANILAVGAVRVILPPVFRAIGLSDIADQLEKVDPTPKEAEAEAAARATEAAAATARAARARAAEAAARAARAAGLDVERVWDGYFSLLDQALQAGPQGTPWSADVIELGASAFAEAGGHAELITAA